MKKLFLILSLMIISLISNAQYPVIKDTPLYSDSIFIYNGEILDTSIEVRSEIKISDLVVSFKNEKNNSFLYVYPSFILFERQMGNDSYYVSFSSSLNKKFVILIFYFKKDNFSFIGIQDESVIVLFKINKKEYNFKLL